MSISDFEFAGSSSRAAQIIAEWGSGGRRLAHFGLLLDYGYMLSYGLFFALAGFRARRGLLSTRAKTSPLLLTLGGHGGSFAPPFATVCSSIKWTLIGIAILYVLSGLVLLLRLRNRPGPKNSPGWFTSANPAAGGTPFVYLILAGAGWSGGFHTEEVVGPRTRPKSGKRAKGGNGNVGRRKLRWAKASVFRAASCRGSKACRQARGGGSVRRDARWA